MRYLSKVASIVCTAAVAISLSGCGGGSSATAPAATPPAPAPEGTPCPIPPSVQEQNIALNQDSTRIIFDVASGAEETNFSIFEFLSREYGYGHTPDSKGIANISFDKKDVVQKRVVSIIADAKELKTKAPSRDMEDITGDNLACDEGTYSLHYSIGGGGGEEDGVYKDWSERDFLASFDNCVLYEGSDKWEQLEDVVEYVLFGTSLVARMRYMTEEDGVFTINGSSKLLIRDEYAESDNYEDGDNFYEESFKNTYNMNIEIENTNLSMDYTINQNQLFTFQSNGKINVDFGIEDNGYQREDREEDDNLTQKDINGNHKFNVSIKTSMDVEELMREGEIDDYDMITFQAYCYSFNFDGTEEEIDYRHEIEDEDGNVTVDDQRNTKTESLDTLANGYVAVNMTGTEYDGLYQMFFDLYQDGFDINYQRIGKSVDNETTHIDDRNETFSINGVIGSTMIGGSVGFVTLDPWESSNHFDTDREDLEEASDLYPHRTPYKGMISVSSLNQAMVGFDYEYNEAIDENVTYGYIQIDDNAPVEYDSIYDMLYDFH